MSEWIDVAVYAALIVVVWGWLPAWNSQLTIPVIADRNPEWLAGHTEIARRLADSEWFRWSCLLWGTVSLALLLAVQFETWPLRLALARDTPKWEALKDLNSALVITGLLYLTACAVFFFRWLSVNVPLAARRQATLDRRSIHDYVPRVVQYTVCGAIALHVGLWAAAGISGRYTTQAFWGALAFQLAISAVFACFVVYAVRRRPAAMDRIFGSGYRRTEVRVAYVMQLLPLVNGAARLYEHVAAVPIDSLDRLLHLGVVLLVVALAIAHAAGSGVRHTRPCLG
jgi:hypothetical protein